MGVDFATTETNSIFQHLTIGIDMGYSPPLILAIPQLCQCIPCGKPRVLSRTTAQGKIIEEGYALTFLRFCFFIRIQLWTKLQSLPGSVQDFHWHPPLWFWPLAFPLSLKSASVLIETTTCTSFLICHVFYLSYRDFGLLFSFKSSGLAHPSHLS